MKNKGFTLIELLVVMAVLAILVTIVVIAIDPEKIINDSNDTKARSELNQVKTSLQLYFNENDSYPSDTPAGAWITALENGYIRKVPTTPTITYGTNGANTNYDAWIAVNNAGSDEQESYDKCTSDLDETGTGSNTRYFICPD